MAVASRRTSGPWAVKDTGHLIAEAGHAGEGEGQLKRAVGTLDLTALGVGAVIGTGIFVVIGEGIGMAGPGVILSFVLAGITCVFSALCYAELASSIPISGSAYTYAYATMGELIAWIIGWDLILEYGVSVAAVAVGWGGNLNEFLDNTFGFALPESVATSPEDGGVFNLPAVLIVVAVTLVLIRGVRETAKANMTMVGIKLLVLAFFIAVAFVAAFNIDNLSPFAPEGVAGIVDAAAIIFFAYIGFDAVSTGAEEAQNPAKSLPIAIVGSLVFCTLLYITVAIAAVGSLDAGGPPGVRSSAGRGARPGRRHLLGGERDGLRGPRGDHERDADHLLRPDPHLLRDGARRPDAAPDRHRRCQHRHARQAHHRAGRPDRNPRRAGSVERDRQAGQHRHAVRVPAREHRRDRAAPDAARHGAPVPGPVRAGVPASSAS